MSNFDHYTDMPLTPDGPSLTITDTDGTTYTLARCTQAKPFDTNTAYANARRIAAAWNACEGIGTVQLERRAVADMMATLQSIAEYSPPSYIDSAQRLADVQEMARTALANVQLSRDP